MPSSTAIDVAIGLAFVYFLLSVLVSAIQETVATFTGRRAAYLRKGLINILTHPAEIKAAAATLERAGRRARDLSVGETSPPSEPDESSAKSSIWQNFNADEQRLVNELLRHPLISPLVKFDKNGNPHPKSPSYLPSRTFVTTMLSIARDEIGARPSQSSPPTATERLDELAQMVEHVPGDRVRGAFRALLVRARSVEHFELLAEQWYDDAMERVSGWYKRRAQLWIWLLGLLLAIALNADTVKMGRALWTEKSVRDAVVQQARHVTVDPAEAKGKTKPRDKIDAAAKSVGKIEELKLPMGYGKGWKPHGWGWPSKALGLFLTGAALALGAPFWFDLLSKLARLRSSGAPPPATKAVRHGEGEETRAGAGATP